MEAEREAERMRETARKEADRMKRQAKEEAEAVVREAQAEAARELRRNAEQEVSFEFCQQPLCAAVVSAPKYQPTHRREP